MTPIGPWFFDDRAPHGATDFVRDALSRRALTDAGLFAPDVALRLRDDLRRAPRGHVTRVRLELVMMLVLSTQLLHRLFVAEATRFPAPRVVLREHAPAHDV
jgi:hypothetical protein